MDFPLKKSQSETISQENDSTQDKILESESSSFHNLNHAKTTAINIQTTNCKISLNMQIEKIQHKRNELRLAREKNFKEIKNESRVLNQEKGIRFVTSMSSSKNVISSLQKLTGEFIIIISW